MELYIIGWFFLGMTGVNLGNSFDKHKGIQSAPGSVWFATFGPLALIAVILHIIITALGSEEGL